MPELITLETDRLVLRPFTLADAACLSRSPASGRVMQKLGVSHEGRLRQHFSRDGHLDDIEAYGMLRAEYRQVRSVKPKSRPQA